MTSFRVERLGFTPAQLAAWGGLPDDRRRSWPVVYTLNDNREVYVGETGSATTRLQQHLANEQKRGLTRARVLFHDEFNRSVCLDLESYLIQLFAGDGTFRVLNRNDGVTDANYPHRETYQETFREIFEALRADGLFALELAEIRNSDLFKLSPFKALTGDQRLAVHTILEGLFAHIKAGTGSTSVVEGGPGTGKTVVAIYLMKLLRDIQTTSPDEDIDGDSPESDFFLEDYPDLLAGFRFALVVPQQSLRASVQRVFKRTPGLRPDMVLTPFQVGKDHERFDLLVVDEAHRLGQRAAQAAGPMNRQFRDINERLFGRDDLEITQLDWIRRQSAHQLFLVDPLQTIRPADLPGRVVANLVDTAKRDHTHAVLETQMRVRAGADYIGFARALVSDDPPTSRPDFGEYELALFDDFGAMQDLVRAKDVDEGLARCVAGYAWPWASKRDASAFDIELDGRRLRWNVQAVDWVDSLGSLEEMGSIHTIQGYDLNYAGVVIGSDLGLDPRTGRLRFHRDSYFDTRGKANNGMLGIRYSDDDLLAYVRNVYGVLLTRGIRGTFVYVCDPVLRERFRRFMATR